MRKLVLLFPLLLAACAQQSAPEPSADRHQEPTVQMTVVATSLNRWPYAAPVTFAVPDNLLYGKVEGKPWLPLFQQSARDYLLA